MHAPDAYGLCDCLRPLPCPAACLAESYMAHWQARLDYFEEWALTGPTLAMPILTQASRHVSR